MGLMSPVMREVLRGRDPYPQDLLALDFAGVATGGRQFYKREGIIVPRFEMLPGALSTGHAGFGKQQVNNAWRGFPANAPLIGDGGLGVWEARTNSIRNPVGAGAVAGTPGTVPTNWSIGIAGVSYSILGQGVESGIPGIYVRFFGTPSAPTFVTLTAELANQVVAAAGQTWTGEFYARLTGGNTTNLLGLSTRLQEYQNATYLAQPVAQPTTQVTSTLARFPASGALGNGSTNRVRSVLTLQGTSGLPVDVTLFIGGANLKLGPDINDPPILQTSGLAATRTAVAQSVGGLVLPSGDFDIEQEFVAGPAGAILRPFELHNGSDAERLLVQVLGDGRVQATVVIANAATVIGTASAGTAAAFTPIKTAIRRRGGAWQLAVNDNLIGSPVTAGLPAINSLILGQRRTGVEFLNSVISRHCWRPA